MLSKSELKSKVTSIDIAIENEFDNSLIIKFDESETIESKLQQLAPHLQLDKSILEYEDGTIQVAPDKLFIWCGDHTIENIISIAKLEASVSEIALLSEQKNIYTITLKDKNIIDVANQINERNLCEYAEPCFVRFVEPKNVYFSQQWGLNNLGGQNQIAGADIKILKAWEISKGSPNIKIAIIDEGVDLGHPDLKANLLPGYDATDARHGGANGGHKGNDAHGTACAGIIAAEDNTIGIIGIAPKCKIIPIRIAYKKPSDGHWEIHDDWIVKGVKHAWQTAQADILSNSWGGGSYSPTVANEFANAIAQGRNNKGCVVLAATGNDDNPTINYPAYIAAPY